MATNHTSERSLFHISFDNISKKKIILVVIALLLAAATIWYVIYARGVTRVKAPTLLLNEGIGTANPSAQQMGGSQAALDAELNKAATNAAKSGVYLRKVDLALTLGEPLSQALNYARQAEALDPSLKTALSLATVYQSQGNKPEAAKAYRLYISRMDAAYRTAHKAEFEYYMSLAAQLEAGR